MEIFKFKKKVVVDEGDNFVEVEAGDAAETKKASETKKKKIRKILAGTAVGIGVCALTALVGTKLKGAWKKVGSEVVKDVADVVMPEPEEVMETVADVVTDVVEEEM